MRKKIVDLAVSCIGIKESNNTHREIIDVYNSHKPIARGYRMTYSDPWCATFISYLAIKLGITDIIPTECGCERQIDLFKKLGEWIESDAYVPEAGDIIYYDWQDNGKGDNKGWSDHVGIVEFCDGHHIRVIEGNKDDAVGRRIIEVDGKYIRGFAVPKYKNVSQAPASPLAPQQPTIGTLTSKEAAQQVLEGKWGNGEDRRKRLAAAGYKYSEVQTWVNCILNGTTPENVAKAVIRGSYGNGKARMEALGRLGYDYVFIQSIVNDILRGN